MPTSVFPTTERTMGNSVLTHPDNRAVPQLRSPRIWGTFSAAGAVGTTTLSLHLAQVALAKGLRTLLVEVDMRAPLREILDAHAPNWEEYRLDTVFTSETLPRPGKSGISLLTKRSATEISAELFNHVIQGAQEHFDLIILDNPPLSSLIINSLVVAENSLTSLIGLHRLAPLQKPKIVLVNKFSPRIKKRGEIESFIADAKLFTIPRSTELGLAMGLGIIRRLTKNSEKIFGEILSEMLH